VDHDEQLAAHELILKSLTAAIVKIDGYMERVTSYLEIITRLLQERRDSDEHNGR